MSGFPEAWQSDVVLSDGRTLHLRPIRPDDDVKIAELHGRLSPATIYYRFFTPLPKLSDAMLFRFVNVDYQDRMAFVALVGDTIVAVSRYDRLPGKASAEVAFLVDDAHQGRGLGSIMLEQLSAYAKLQGINHFYAETLPDNVKMLKVFLDAGYKVKRSVEDGVIEVGFDIDVTPESQRMVAEREHRSTVRSVQAIVEPATIAVVGASRVEGSLGNIVLAHLLAGNFSGRIFPVNPNAESVRGVTAYPTMAAIGEPVDLAIIMVRASAVRDVLDDAAAAGAKSLLILSAGFSDSSPEGVELEKTLVGMARSYGMRVVGPNSMGVANPAFGLQATVSPLRVNPGNASVHAQSGPLSLAIIAELQRVGLGIASFVSSGNKADISGNDLMAWWEDDPNTKLVLLYIEDFGNPRTFARIARRLSRKKPVIAVKSNRSGPTSTMAFGELRQDEAVQALMRQTGVLRVDTLEQLVQLARAMSAQPLPAGNRVAVLANKGGPGPLVADTLATGGLTLGCLSEDTAATVRGRLGTRLQGNNPFELDPAATPEEWGWLLKQVLSCPEIDAAVVSFVPTVVGTYDDPRLIAPPIAGGELRGVPNAAADLAADVAGEVAAAAQQEGIGKPKPVLANFLALPGVPAALSSTKRQIPSYAFPESAALVLGRMYEYAQWLEKPTGTPLVRPKLERERVLSAMGSPLPQPAWELDAAATDQVLKILEIPTLPPPGARREELDHRAVEIAIELIHDRRFGPYLKGSLSGVANDLLGATTIRALPQTDLDLARFIASIPGISILNGYGRVPPISSDSLTGLLLKLVSVGVDLFEMKAMKLDPISLTTAGIYVKQARMIIRGAGPSPYMLTRSLRDPGAPSG